MSKESKDQNSDLLLATANNDLALRLHKELSAEGKNLFFSPFSITLAMSMLFRGTRGKAAAEMRKAMGFDAANLPSDDVHKSAEKLLNILTEVQDSYVLAVANAIVSQKAFPFVPSYKEDLQKIYRALALEVDFVKESGSALAQINEWVKTNTRDMIPKIFDELSPATVLVLLNAVYFKGLWLHKFDKERTRPMPFINKGAKDQAKDVAMMCITKEFSFTEKENFKVLELPYNESDISMFVVLPRENNGLSLLEGELQRDFISDIKKEMYKTKVIVSLPKLHLLYEKTLNDVFKSFGLNSIFGGNADFSGLSSCAGLCVSEIIHKAVLDVNEEGSEAAAVTAIRMVRCCMIQPPTPEFRADHPFLFFIYDNKNELILFMGRVNEM